MQIQSIQDLIAKAEKLISKDQLNCYKILEQLIDNQIKDYKLDKVLANYYYYNQNYEKAIYYSDQYIEKKKDIQLRFQNDFDIYYYKANSLYYLRCFSHSKQYFETILQNIKPEQQQSQFKAEIKQKLKAIDLILEREKIKVDPKILKQENEQLIEKIKECDANDFNKITGYPVFLLSLNWFNQWERYTSQQDLEEMQNEHAYQQQYREQHSDNHYPGPIDNYDIIEYIQNIQEDPDQMKQYTKYSLRNNFYEKKHYIILSYPSMKFLIDKYDYFNIIQRPVIKANENTCIVEANLVKVQFIQIKENIKMHIQGPDIVQASRKEYISNLQCRINRVLKKENEEVKLWKVQINQINEIQQNLQNSNYQSLQINGILLDPNEMIEDCEISDDDIILVEYKQNFGQWIIQKELSGERCGYCQKNDGQLYFCECRLIKYCDENCQKKGREAHKVECMAMKKIISEKKQLMDRFKVKIFNQRDTQNSRNGICGLQNLGNTCFMNSSLQCLSNVWELTNYMKQNLFLEDINRSNPLGTGGYLASAYAELIKCMWLGSNNYESPWHLKRVIGKYAPQFSGYNQQDSQELLSYLLDGIHEDLNKIQNKPYLEQIESDGSNDKEVAEKSWNNYQKRNKSIITDLMVGMFKSTLVCPSCNKKSVTFDPFMTISVPMPSVPNIDLILYYVKRDGNELPYKIKIKVKFNEEAKDIKKKISSLVEVEIENLIFCFIQQQKIAGYVQDNHKADYINDHQGIFFVFERLNPEYDQDVPNNKREQVNLEILITNDDLGSQDQFQLTSFQRQMVVGINSTYKTIHLKLWQMLRSYILPCLQLGNYVQNTGMNQIQKEYDQLFNQQEDEEERPYIIYLQEIGQLKYSEKMSLKSEFKKEKMDTMTILIKINSVVQNIKLNSYQDFSYPQNYMSSSKDIQQNYTLYDCLDLFVKEEVLEKGNEWYCANCKTHKNATKKMEIYQTPKILIIHLKRFKTLKNSYSIAYFSQGGQKLDDLIVFPIKSLNLKKYVIKDDCKNLTYDLFAISNHYGNMSGGHYTAYAKNHINQEWYDFNDSKISKVSESKLVDRSAYVLFYRLRE